MRGALETDHRSERAEVLTAKALDAVECGREGLVRSTHRQITNRHNFVRQQPRVFRVYTARPRRSHLQVVVVEDRGSDDAFLHAPSINVHPSVLYGIRGLQGAGSGSPLEMLASEAASVSEEAFLRNAFLRKVKAHAEDFKKIEDLP